MAAERTPVTLTAGDPTAWRYAQGVTRALGMEDRLQFAQP